MLGGAGVSRTDTDHADAVEDFAAELRALRGSAGNPSFREMAGRSRAISHTTLHEAIQGHRLPSWATTVEFVKACGCDPQAHRVAWEAANQAIRADVTEHVLPLDSTAPASPPVSPPVAAAEQPAGRRPGRARRWYATIATVVVGGGGVTAIAALAPNAAGNPTEHESTAWVQPPPNSADCPIRQASPQRTPPLHRGDAAKLVEDATLPDCTRVSPRETYKKVWRFKNIGTVPWRGYSLHRIDLPQRRDQCQTVVDIPVPDTAPGELVDIETMVTTPQEQVFCFVRFKMVDADGNFVYPGSRPANFQLIVE